MRDVPAHELYPARLTDEQVDAIADKAAEKAVELVFDRLYQEVGKSVVRKVTWALGLMALVFLVWLAGKGEYPK